MPTETFYYDSQACTLQYFSTMLHEKTKETDFKSFHPKN